MEIWIFRPAHSAGGKTPPTTLGQVEFSLGHRQPCPGARNPPCPRALSWCPAAMIGLQLTTDPQTDNLDQAANQGIHFAVVPWILLRPSWNKFSLTLSKWIERPGCFSSHFPKFGSAVAERKSRGVAVSRLPLLPLGNACSNLSATSDFPRIIWQKCRVVSIDKAAGFAAKGTRGRVESDHLLNISSLEPVSTDTEQTKHLYFGYLFFPNLTPYFAYFILIFPYWPPAAAYGVS